MRARLENICGQWHFTATATGKARIASAIPCGSNAIRLPLQHASVAQGNKRDKEYLMLDVLMLALGLGFFVLAVGYTYACERL